MSQDFANGARRSRSPRSDARTRQRRRESPFHWGSFGAGIALGVALTLVGELLPEWRGDHAVPKATPPPAGDAAPITRFEFFDRLPNEKISPRPPSELPAKPGSTADSNEYSLQAGSFTNKEDADRLRDSLAESNFTAETAKVQLSSGAVRYRVIVGPFASSQDTQRAIAQLRKRDVDALVLARKPGG
ncbi:MAG TPA: SPOR domain-containing protein [Pseudomonadales bacterium]|nr:SPOR domain-containing protein [Pseudomonadales bacterium]